jgi:RNA-directed DNA polymerase
VLREPDSAPEWQGGAGLGRFRPGPAHSISLEVGVGGRLRLGILALRLGGLFALWAAGAWAVVAAFGTDQLPVAGWLSVAWTITVIAIAVLVGLRRRLVGALGIVAGLWSASFAIQLATEPAGDVGSAFGNFWFVMPLIGLFVAGLSGAGSSPRLLWFGRGLAVLWLVGAVMWLSFDELGGPIGGLSGPALRVVAIQWLGLVGFAVWSLWSAGRLAADTLTPRAPTVRAPDLASDEEAQRGWMSYGPWPRRLARVTAIAAALLLVPLVLDRFAGRADLRVETFELVFGLSFAALAIVLGNTTPRLGHTRLDVLGAVPHVGIIFGLTEPALIGGLIVAVLDGAIATDAGGSTALVGFVFIGWWVGRVASRQRLGSRRLGLLTGAGLIVGSSWGATVAQTGGNVVVPGIVLAISLTMLVAWIWQLGSVLTPGLARPAEVFALPGISSGAVPSAPPVFAPGAVMPRRARTTAPVSHAGPVSAPFSPAAESPTRFDIEELARRTGLTLAELRAARPTYRRVSVPKRSGGTRELLVPADATKALQRRLLRRVLARIPIHPAAHGFERGRSIVTNAASHTGRAVVVRMDVIEFFGSSSARRVRRLFRVLGWDAETAELLTRLTTHDGGLPTGAPTSPRLANLVNVLLDARLAGLADALGARYTRYADDLTFSFERDDHAALADLLGATRRIARAHGYRLHVERKLQIRRRHHRQTVTGLVVNERVALPRHRRRWLRAVEHHLYSGREATLSREKLAGWQAFESMVETSTAADRG